MVDSAGAWWPSLLRYHRIDPGPASNPVAVSSRRSSIIRFVRVGLVCRGLDFGLRDFSRASNPSFS